MKKLSKAAAGLFLSGTLAASLAVSAPAQASTAGRKNTAIALGAVAVQQLLTGKTTTGLLAAGATALAYKNYKDSKDDDERQDRWDRYRRDTRRSDRRGNARFHRGSGRR